MDETRYTLIKWPYRHEVQVSVNDEVHTVYYEVPNHDGSVSYSMATIESGAPYECTPEAYRLALALAHVDDRRNRA